MLQPNNFLIFLGLNVVQPLVQLLDNLVELADFIVPQNAIAALLVQRKHLTVKRCLELVVLLLNPTHRLHVASLPIELAGKIVALVSEGLVL